jgi:hypothetical protein
MWCGCRMHFPLFTYLPRKRTNGPRKKIRGRRDETGTTDGGITINEPGGRCLLDEEGDELISVRVEGVLDAVADARNAVQLRGGHGCRLPVVWCDGGGE